VSAFVPHLHRWSPALAGTLPYLQLGRGPTPVRPLEGLDGVWVKDEGTYGDGRWGGNKIRKLEWTLADARRKGRSTVLTFGAIGTNHGLATARYAIDNGFGAAVAVVDQPEDEHVLANFERLQASGASVHRTHTNAMTALAAPWLLARHGRPYVLPAGGSSPVGALGYVEASFEIAEQVRDGVLPRPSTIVCAVGTSGTLSGLMLGLRLAGLPDVRVLGVVVNDALPLDARRSTRLAMRSAAVLRERGATIADRDIPTVTDAHLTWDALGDGYGHATPEATAAAALAAERWGLQLDPVYTAKAFGHVLRPEARIALGATPSRPVLFLDTNGPRP
jgi:D-cysteine desulfhydrase